MIPSNGRQPILSIIPDGQLNCKVLLTLLSIQTYLAKYFFFSFHDNPVQDQASNS